MSMSGTPHCAAVYMLHAAWRTARSLGCSRCLAVDGCRPDIACSVGLVAAQSCVAEPSLSGRCSLAPAAVWRQLCACPFADRMLALVGLWGVWGTHLRDRLYQVSHHAGQIVLVQHDGGIACRQLIASGRADITCTRPRIPFLAAAAYYDGHNLSSSTAPGFPEDQQLGHEI